MHFDDTYDLGIVSHDEQGRIVLAGSEASTDWDDSEEETGGVQEQDVSAKGVAIYEGETLAWEWTSTINPAGGRAFHLGPDGALAFAMDGDAIELGEQLLDGYGGKDMSVVELALPQYTRARSPRSRHRRTGAGLRSRALASICAAGFPCAR